MKILLVAATKAEIEPLLTHFELNCNHSNPNPIFEYLITGVGMVATTFTLTKHLSTTHYDLIINAGIAGSFDKHLKNGTLVHVVKDTFSEMGAEDHDSFITLTELGYGQCTFTFDTTNINLPKVTAITVNTVHGNAKSIEVIKARLNPEIESMEGAAVYYVSKQFNIPCLQIRAISNLVEPRNKSNWTIGLAIQNLNTWLINYFSNEMNCI
jgi:futalosine hydrolase